MRAAGARTSREKGKEPNYFELFVLPLNSKIQGIGFRSFIARHAPEFNVVTVPINYPGGEVFIQVWGSEKNAMAFKRFLEKNKPRKNIDYRITLISKSLRTEDKFEVLYFTETPPTLQARTTTKA